MSIVGLGSIVRLAGYNLVITWPGGSTVHPSRHAKYSQLADSSQTMAL